MIDLLPERPIDQTRCGFAAQTCVLILLENGVAGFSTIGSWAAFEASIANEYSFSGCVAFEDEILRPPTDLISIAGQLLQCEGLGVGVLELWRPFCRHLGPQ